MFEINVSDRVKADEDQRKQQQASHVRPGVVRAMPQAQQALQDMIIARQQAAGNRQALVPPPGIAAAEIRPALRAYEGKSMGSDHLERLPVKRPSHCKANHLQHRGFNL